MDKNLGSVLSPTLERQETEGAAALCSDQLSSPVSHGNMPGEVSVDSQNVQDRAEEEW